MLQKDSNGAPKIRLQPIILHGKAGLAVLSPGVEVKLAVSSSSVLCVRVCPCVCLCMRLW